MKNALILTLLVASLVFAGCTQQTQPSTIGDTDGQIPRVQENNNSMQQPPTPELRVPSQAQLSLTSSAFSNNGAIPNKYSCDGGDVIPPLQFAGVPQNTQSLVLIMDDPDAVAVVGFVYVHWVVFDIPAMATEMPEGTQIGIIGSAGSGQKKYEGPCPPEGETHTYSFRLYALDIAPQLQEGATKQEVETAMQGHILAQSELKGTYGQ